MAVAALALAEERLVLICVQWALRVPRQADLISAEGGVEDHEE
jgi:hypothetical protein